jgi:hypothetical protein
VNSIWNKLYDAGKDRRYGVLFMACLAAFPVTLIAGVLLHQAALYFGLNPTFLWALPCLLALWFAASLVSRIRSRDRRRLRFPPLSRDELNRARSKLMEKQNRRKP